MFKGLYWETCKQVAIQDFKKYSGIFCQENKAVSISKEHKPKKKDTIHAKIIILIKIIHLFLSNFSFSSFLIVNSKASLILKIALSMIYERDGGQTHCMLGITLRNAEVSRLKYVEPR